MELTDLARVLLILTGIGSRMVFPSGRPSVCRPRGCKPDLIISYSMAAVLLPVIDCAYSGVGKIPFEVEVLVR